MPDAIRNLGITRLILIAGVTLSVIVFFVFLASRVAKPDMALLYQDLDTGDAASIVQMLEGQNVPYELGAGGKEIFVPRDRVDRMRMEAAEAGLPMGGSIGYEVFDNTDSLGTTNFVQNVNLLRALEGELSRTITSLDRVDAARVHLVLPKREVFQRKDRDPSASIMIRVRGNLGGERVNAIQNLVAAAVPGLEPGRVSVVDSRGNLLSRGLGNGGGNSAASPSALTDIRLAHEQRIKRAVESLLEQAIGHGRVRAEVTVEVDHDRVTTQSETFDPDGAVVRATEVREESSTSSEGQEQDAVTVATNLPGQEFGASGGNQSRNNDSLTEERTEFEISRQQTTQIREPGVIKRLSVAVLVDGAYAADAEGNRTYTPRSEEELTELTRLVRSAVGFDEERGDKVEISNLRFADIDAVFEAPPAEFEIMGFSKNELLRMGETLMLGLIALLVMLMVVRPMLRRIMSGADLDRDDDTLAIAGAGGDLNAALAAAGRAGDGELALPGPDGTMTGGGSGVPMATGDGETLIAGAGGRRKIDFSHVEGNVKDSSLAKIAEIVDRHPDEAVAILRNWLYQDR